MSPSLLESLRSAQACLRLVASVVLVTFTLWVTAPTAAVAQAGQQTGTPQAPAMSLESRLAALIMDVDSEISALAEAISDGGSIASRKSRLIHLRDELLQLDPLMMEKLSEIGERIADYQLAETISERHAQEVERYRADFDRLLELLAAVEVAESTPDLAAAVNNVRRWLEDKPSHQPPRKFDPNNLPTKTKGRDPNNKPRERQVDFTSSGLYSTPTVRQAALGDFVFDDLPGAIDPAYLAATDEVNLSQPILDKAAELNRDPVQIYYWVRNHVEWLPSWGAIQDAELTLSARRGNAMDIASLTIALLRASGIPARYVHGTIDVPPDLFMNWAGGFTNVEAAGDYAASAGLPLTLVTITDSDGTRQVVRMEHVWVEAAVDYTPSRGAENRDADRWLELDPSYKQYTFIDPLDSLQAAGIDIEDLVAQFHGTMTVNDAEGWISGFDNSLLSNTLDQGFETVRPQIDSLPDPQLFDIIGGAQKIVKEFPLLPADLPYQVTVEGARYDRIPSSLQQTVTFSLGADILGEPIDPRTFAWSVLNNEKVLLSFRPATQADADALDAFIPDTVNDQSELPTSMPSSLLRLVPELKVNGEVVMSGAALQPGEDLDLVWNIDFVGSGSESRISRVVAGSLLSVNVIAGSVSQDKLLATRQRLADAKSVIESGTVGQIEALTRDGVLGDMFYAGSLAYYLNLVVKTRLLGAQAGGQQYLAAGYGTLGYEPNVAYFFGFPQSIEQGGVVLDIPMVTVTHMKDGDVEERRNYVLGTGIVGSALEHGIPEAMFTTDPNNPADAISAVKAIQKANLSGQRIYHITCDNRDTALPQIHHDSEAMAEISAALSAGKEVITHTDPIAMPGWTGSGYVIFDPVSGDGAYKISGGTNGAFFWVGFTFGFLFSMSLVIGLKAGSAHVLVVALGLLIAAIAVWHLYGAIWGEDAQKCFVTGLAYGALAAGLTAALFSPLLGLGYGRGLLVAIIGAMGFVARDVSGGGNPLLDCI